MDDSSNKQIDPFPFQKLPLEMQTEVLSKLDENELLSSRRVSKLWKYNADYLLQKIRIGVLVSRGCNNKHHYKLIILRNSKDINLKIIQSIERLKFICSMFPRTKEVIIVGDRRHTSKLNFKQILDVCKERLRKVEILKLCDSSLVNEDYLLIPEIFPHTKHITIDLLWTSARLNDQTVSKLLLSLTEVTSVKMCGLGDLSDACFQNVSNRIRQLCWHSSGTNKFNGFHKFEKLESVTIINTRLGELAPLVAPNIEHLRIIREPVNFDYMDFKRLKSVILEEIIIARTTSETKLMEVTDLTVTDALGDRISLTSLLLKFPNLKRVVLKYVQQLWKTRETFLELRSLEYITIKDRMYSKEQLLEFHTFAEDIEAAGYTVNVLSEFISSIYFVKVIKVHIEYNRGIEGIEEINNDLNKFCEFRRPQQNISVTFERM
ncbi:hypothetical protein B4U80_13642 [Leptotrombidium deliense]|uniref:F-box domain-containing protein n=1 Tax=Leptotrombidium deliense TaxID=299467 RepID=A0A443SQA4_9ACAR|nr:hypothetical protein B4U80_13642 [Leptotrombidium deliense]